MLSRLNTIVSVVRAQLAAWVAITLGLSIFYYVGLLIAVVLKFGQLPNYVTHYEWLGNVRHIIASTPSVKDQIAIIKEEWLFEVGYMNYAFGMGISEWSLFILPMKVLEITFLSALVATVYLLLREKRKVCSVARLRTSSLAGCVGASCVAVTSITLSWIVCCSTPTWVVGLAMMGLGVSTSLWLEPIGGWVNLFGFLLLLSAAFTLAGNNQILATTTRAKIQCA